MKLRLMLFVCLLGGAVNAVDIDRPNVIFLLCDDLGYGDVGYVQKTRATGSVLIQTPVIDNLATNGTILTDHYCASPVCAPSRASILTGKLAHSCSMNCADKTMCYDYPILETKTLGTVMRDAGYATFAIGKWGVAGGGETNFPRIAHPLARGFDHYYGFMDHATGHTYYHYDANLNQCYGGIYESGSRPAKFSGSEYNTINSLTKIPTGDETWNYWNATKTAEGRYSTDVFIARAKKYIEDHVKENEEAGTKRPFFMYFAVNTVHGSGKCEQNTSLPKTSANQQNLLVPGGAYKSSTANDGSVIWPLQVEPMESRNTWIDPRYANANIDSAAKRYATTISRLDDALGDLVAYLKQKGIYENTIIIFTSDNGPAEEYGTHPHYFQSNGPEFVGRKRDVYEGGQRIPAFISWPGNPAAAKKVISEPSISPDWMGALEALIADPTHVPVPVSPRVETIYQSDGGSVVDRQYRGGQQRMKRVGDLVYLQAGGFGNPVQVYNIKDDPAEAHPLSSEYLPGFRYRFNGDFADSGLPCTFGSPNVLTAVGETMGTFVDHGNRKALKIAHGVTGQDNNENDYTLGRFQSVKSSLGNGANNAKFTALVNAKVAPVAKGKKAVLWSFGGQTGNFSGLAADATNNKLYWYANGAQRAEIDVPDMATGFHHYAVLGTGSEVQLLVDGLTEQILSANYPATSANMYGLGAPSIAMEGLVEAVDTEIEDFTVYQQRMLSASEVREIIGAPSVKVGDQEFSTLAEAITACPNETLTILGDIDEAWPINLTGPLTLEVRNNFRIATAFSGAGKIVKKGAGVLTFTGSLPSGGLTIDLAGVTPGELPWTVAAFASVPNLEKLALVNGPEGTTLAAYGKRVVILAAGETLEQPKIIALNLNAGRGRNGNGSDANKLASGTDAGIPDWVLPGSAWTQVMSPSSSSAQALTIFDEATQSAVVGATTPKATWSSANNYTVGNNSANVLEGYLDDVGNHAQIFITDIPFDNYDALILAATDTADKKFSPITVNGMLYKSNEKGEGVSASGAADTWGASQQTTITLGVNAFYVRGLTRSSLSIIGGANANGARGGISAVVLFGQLSAKPAPIVAPEATAEWDGDFMNGASEGNYSLDIASSETIGEDGYITIGSTGTTAGGIRINHNPLTAGCAAMTILMKIANLPTNIADMMLVSIRNVNGSMVNDPDGIWFANGLVPYEINGGNKGTGAGSTQTALTADLTERRLAMVYEQGGMIKFYEIINGTATEVFSKNAYKSLSVAGISIGQTRAGSQDLNAATGMKLQAVAVFESVLTAQELAAYRFPSDAPSSQFVEPDGSEDENGVAPYYWYQFNGNTDRASCATTTIPDMNTLGSEYVADRGGQDGKAIKISAGLAKNVQSEPGRTCVATTNPNANDSFTVSCTAKVTPIADNKALLWCFGSNNDNMLLVADTENKQIEIIEDNSTIRYEINVNDLTEAFHTYVLVGRGSSTVDFYIDGVKQSAVHGWYPNATKTAFGLASFGLAGGSVFSVSGIQGAIGSYIDDFRVYRGTALTDAQVAKIGANMYSPYEPPAEATATIATGTNAAWGDIEWNVMPVFGKTALTVTIEAGASLTLTDVSQGRLLTIAGAGKVIAGGNVRITLKDSAPFFMLDEAWTGTVEFTNITMSGDGSVDTWFDLNRYGNEKSTVKLVGAQGYMKTNVIFQPEVILANSSLAGIEFINGSSNSPIVFRKVSGSGNIVAGATSAQKVAIGDASTHTGQVKMQNNKGITLGSTTNAAGNNQIVVADGATITFANQQWIGAGGISFGETLNVIGSVGSVLRMSAAPTILPTTVKLVGMEGDYTLKYENGSLKIAEAEKPIDWPKNPDDVKGKTVAEVYGEAVPVELAAAPADALVVWAKGVGNVNFSDKGGINSNAFLLNCANDTVVVEVESKDFKITADDLATILAAVKSGKEIPEIVREIYPNAKIVISEVELPGADSTTAKFWKAELKLK